MSTPGKGEVDLPVSSPPKTKRRVKRMEMKKPRQRISKNQTRKLQINVSVSDEEKGKISKYARDGHMSVSEYCRVKSLQYPLSRKLDRAVLQDLLVKVMQNTVELKRIGNNINQLAHVANKTGLIPDSLKDAHGKLSSLLSISQEVNELICLSMKGKSRVG